jgi:hypothetical protein
MADPTSTTSSSSRNLSLTNTPALCRIPQLNQHGHPLDSLSRTYAAPTALINVAEALELPAQPGTFRYQLEKEREKGGGERKGNEMSNEEKREEFERVKQALKDLGK